MAFDRQAAAAWYRRNRERSRALFDLLTDETYYSRPISLRHPIVFYEGHLPGFSFNTLVKKGLGRPSIDARLETLFARGIDPHEGKAEEGKAGRQGDIDRPGHPVLDRAEAAFTILEHEVMRYSAFRFGPRPKTTQEAAYIIDTHPIVEAFVKNAGLGFAIPYLHNGQPHDYVPDFIVRLKTAPATSLIIETKGFDELAEVKAAAAQRWVAAVNADGRFGRWHYEMARQVPRVRAILDAFA